MSRLRVLQLDTQFPRPAGDVGSPDSYLDMLEISIIPKAYVGDIITTQAERFDISSFRMAVSEADEPLIITSCGFMIYWQNALASQCRGRFISSSLTALPDLCTRYKMSQILIMTFDAQILTSDIFSPSLSGFTGPVLGLDKQSHLYEVISQNRTSLDRELAAQQLCTSLRAVLAHTDIRAILLECTNLSVYKPDIRQIFNGEIIDMLSLVDRYDPGLVKDKFK